MVVGGNATKAEINLRLPMTIGRNKDAGLTIGHTMVSRIHCQLYELDNALVIRDNNSSNGTVLNGEKVREAVVKPGDKLIIGPLTFVAIYQHTGNFPSLTEEALKERSLKTEADETETSAIDDDTPSAIEERAASDLFSAAKTMKELPSDPEDMTINLDSPFADFEKDDADFLLPLDSEPDLDSLEITEEPSAEGSSDQLGDEKQFRFFIQIDHVGDLKSGSTIRAAGKPAGTVTDIKKIDINGITLFQVELCVPESLGELLYDDMHVSVLFDSNADAVLEIHSPGETGKPLTADCIVEINPEEDDSVLDEEALLGTDSVLGGGSDSLVDELLDEIPDAEDIGPIESVDTKAHEINQDIDAHDLDIFNDDSSISEGNVLESASEGGEHKSDLSGFDEDGESGVDPDSDPASDVNAFFAAFTDDDEEEAGSSNANAFNPETDL